LIASVAKTQKSKYSAQRHCKNRTFDERKPAVPAFAKLVEHVAEG
jgi:hypothetical protein